MINPFEIKTPEQNSAQDVVDLFVNVFADFKQVLEKGHTFLNGPRGSGKSMMFRYIQPDCQYLSFCPLQKRHCLFSGLFPDFLSLSGLDFPLFLQSINMQSLHVYTAFCPFAHCFHRTESLR